MNTPEAYEGQFELSRRKGKLPPKNGGELDETPEGLYETIREFDETSTVSMKENEAYATNTQAQHIATATNEAYGCVEDVPVAENVAYIRAAVNIPTVQNEAYGGVSGAAVNTDTEEQVNEYEEL